MNPPLRVLHLAKHAPPSRGGIETVIAELIGERGRDPRGTVSTFLCFADRSEEKTRGGGVVLLRCRTTTRQGP